jgi:hypothetical protein
MSSTDQLSEFAAHLRGFIRFASDPTAGNCDPHFESLALQLFALQFERNPPFRRFCQGRAATPETVRHWRQIPAVPAAAFKEWELSCIHPDQRTAVFHSSGTSARLPSRHFHNSESLAIYEASLLPWFHRHLLDTPGAPSEHAAKPRILSLTPPPEPAPQSSLVHMFATVMREFGAHSSGFFGELDADGAWLVDFNRTRQTLAEACDLGQPVLLLGTAFGCVHLLDHLGQNRLRFALPAGSRIMETGGYKGRSRALSRRELHGLMARRLGVPLERIVCEYGMSELSSQAYAFYPGANAGQPVEPAPFHFPPWARATIVSPETGLEAPPGKPGLIRVLDLANVFSALAIQTEDLGVRRGDGFELAGRAEAAEPRGCSLMATDLAA